MSLPWPPLPNLTCVNSGGITEGVTHVSVIGAWSSPGLAGLAPESPGRPAAAWCRGLRRWSRRRGLYPKGELPHGKGNTSAGCWAPAKWRGGLLALFGLRMWDWAVRIIKIQILRTEVERFRERVMTQTLPFLLPNISLYRDQRQPQVFTYPDLFHRLSSPCFPGPSHAHPLSPSLFYGQWKCLYPDVRYQTSVLYTSRTD